jgi:transposase-like protein
VEFLMVEIVKEKIKPICPHCEKELDKLVEVNRGWFSVNRVFCCPECHKIVGMSAGAQ